MKNKIKFLQFVAILFFSFSTYSQVTVSVQNLQYTNNGQSTVSPANCGNIDLASSTSTSINLGINLSKPNGQVVGLSDLRVYTQKSSADSRIERSWVQISESSWSTGTPNTRSSSASFSINSFDFNVSGGTLFVVFKSNGGAEYQTACSFTITKTPPPSFSFTPTSLSLACGDTAPRTFTVTPANIPNGATVTYNWSYSGWTLVNSTATSRTLQPTSGSILPSNVSVTPSINVVAQATKTCTVTRTAIATSGTISGNNTVCTSRTYTLTGLLSGQTVNWSLSNTTTGTISTTTGASTTFTKTGSGIVDLTANVSNGCGQSYTKTISLFGGSPPAFSMSYDLFENQYCDTKYHQVPFIFTIPPGATLNITFKYPNASHTITSLGNNQYRYTFAFSKTYSGFFNIMANISNSCGTSYFESEGEYTIQSCSEIGSPNAFQSIAETENEFVVYPNPSEDLITIELKKQENQSDKNQKISGELFDLTGESKTKIQLLENKTTFSVKELKKGIYVLKIFTNEQTETHEIVVE